MAEREEAETAPVAGNSPPNGLRPMYISMKNMEKYNLKVGDGLGDTVDYRIFNKKEVLDEIQSVGFYSDFFVFKNEIKVCSCRSIQVLSPATMFHEWFRHAELSGGETDHRS